MPPRYEPSDPCSDVAAVAAARSRLDSSIIGYNRHARLVASFRHATRRFERAREDFEQVRSDMQSTLDTSTQIRRMAGLERLRAARECADFHRAAVELGIRSYVHRLRDEGLPPEKVLVAVKQRLVQAVTATAPAAPELEAVRLAEDVSAWTIRALFDRV